MKNHPYETFCEIFIIIGTSSYNSSTRLDRFCPLYMYCTITVNKPFAFESNVVLKNYVLEWRLSSYFMILDRESCQRRPCTMYFNICAHVSFPLWNPRCQCCLYSVILWLVFCAIFTCHLSVDIHHFILNISLLYYWYLTCVSQCWYYWNPALALTRTLHLHLVDITVWSDGPRLVWVLIAWPLDGCLITYWGWPSPVHTGTFFSSRKTCPCVRGHLSSFRLSSLTSWKAGVLVFLERILSRKIFILNALCTGLMYEKWNYFLIWNHYAQSQLRHWIDQIFCYKKYIWQWIASDTILKNID